MNFGHMAALAASLAFMFLYQLVQYKTHDLNFIYRVPTAFRGFFYACIFLTIVIFGKAQGGSFIYFQF